VEKWGGRKGRLVCLLLPQLQPPLVGSGCFKQRQGLQLRYPASHGVMQDWGEMVHVWRHAFKEQLGLASTSDCKVS
jgi:actin-related protein 2